ncbi:DUF4199 domain-containing protein [Robiginitalea sp. IMCC43444]|uniref:DUF4199 domain-containing protein n=1 Tax=Robiginitalea sp. IMCC43444 TaxID=3459121 RepID=UPI004042F961
MENQEPKTSKYALRYGIILGGISIVFGIMLYSLDMHYDQGWQIGLVNIVIMIAVIIMAIIAFRKDNGGLLSLGQALKVGVGTALIAGILGIIYQMVLMNVIEPDFMANMMEIRKGEMIAENPNMTQEQIDAASEMMQKFSGPGIVVAFSLIGSLFFGFIFSLIGGLILKRSEAKS